MQDYTAQLTALNAPATIQEINSAVQADPSSALAALVNNFNGSAESVALYGTSNDAASVYGFVNNIYKNILHRDADVDGGKYWVNAILNGGLSKANAALAITEGALSNTTAQGLIDAKVIANTQAVATDFTNSLDTLAKIAAFSGTAAAAAAHNLLQGVTATTDLTAEHAVVQQAIDGLFPTVTTALTTGIDTLVGTSANDVFNAFTGVIGTTPADTFGALDSIDGGAGNNVLNIASSTTKDLTLSSAATVKNVQTANITSSSTLSGNVAGWTGLTSVTATEFGGSTAAGSFTAAGTTTVHLTDLAAAHSTISVQGGSDVTVVANEIDGAGTINVGTTTAATGKVNVTANVSATGVAAFTADAINVKGGSDITVTANLTEAGGAGHEVVGGTIAVTGTAATKTVTVTQTALGDSANAAPAIVGAVARAAVTAAPGVNGVTAVTGATPQDADVAYSGVVDGAVHVTDAAFGSGGANSIATVTLANHGAGSYIYSDALTSLSLSGESGDLTLKRGGAATDSLALNLNGYSYAGGEVNQTTDNTITDFNNEIKTLNVTVTGNSAALNAFADTGLTTLNVAGDHTLSLTTVNASLSKIAVTGAAGFSGDVSGLHAGLTSFTTTSSGKITATLDAVNQTFTGASGQDVITIADDAAKAITGGSGTKDILVLNANATTFNATAAKLTTTDVKGFEVLGTGTASQGTFDMSTLPTDLKSIEMMGNAAGTISFTKVTGTALTIDKAQTNTISYQAADANGSADALSLTLGTATTHAGFNVASLTLKDANDVGLGTVNLVSNASTFNTSNSITSLVDNGLSNLNVSGTGGLTISSINQTATQATALTINNTSTGVAGVSVTSLVDANLGSLTFKGTGASNVGTLDGLTGKVLTISNTGTGTAAVAHLGTQVGSETNDVTLSTLTAGQSVTVDGRTVTLVTGASASAAQVAAVMASGVDANGLHYTAGLTTTTATTDGVATGHVLFTSTTSNTNVGPITITTAGLAAATAPGAGGVTDGTAGTPESTAWTVTGLTDGQSITIDGFTVTATGTMTDVQVAGAFAAGGTGANYTTSGSINLPTGWTGSPAFTSTGAGNVTLTNTVFGDVATQFTAAGSANPAGSAPTAPTTVNVDGVASGGGFNAMETITLNGNVAIGSNSNPAVAEQAIGGHNGITVNGATDNAHVNIHLNSAIAGATNTITLGNANNFITDDTSAGAVKVTVGTGYNLIDVSHGGNNTTYSAAVTLGAHTNTTSLFDKVLVSVSGAALNAPAANTSITGAVAGDVIVFADAHDVAFLTGTAATALQTAATAAANLTAALNLAFGASDAHGHSAVAFQYQGDTYIVEDVDGGRSNTVNVDSIVKIVGLHTVADFGSVNGAVTIAS